MEAQQAVTDRLTFRVYGVPKPQGSKRIVPSGRGNTVHVIEASKGLGDWRHDVKMAAFEQTHGVMLFPTGALSLTVWFYLPRPKTARAARFSSRRPDLSKLIRGVEDALTEVNVWRDDAQVATYLVSKQYADGSDPPGAVITIGREED